MLVEVAFAAVFPFVKLERLDDAAADEFFDRGVGGRKAQAFLFLSCLAVDEGRAGVNMPLLNQHIDDGQSLTRDFQAFLLQALNRVRLSGRGLSRVLKVSRTIADLSASDDIRLEDVAEALSYREGEALSWMKV